MIKRFFRQCYLKQAGVNSALRVFSFLFLFMVFVLGNSEEAGANSVPDDFDEVVRMTKSLETVAGISAACVDHFTLEDTRKLQNSIIASALKNGIFQKDEVGLMKSLNQEHFDKIFESTTRKLSNTRTDCDKAVRELKKMKHILGLLDENDFDSLGLLCGRCHDDSCDQKLDVVDPDTGKIDGLVIIFSDEGKEYSDYFKSYVFDSRWSVNELTYENNDKEYHFPYSSISKFHELSIDRLTGIAYAPSNYTYYVCESEQTEIIRSVWFKQKRLEYLNKRKF